MTPWGRSITSSISKRSFGNRSMAVVQRRDVSPSSDDAVARTPERNDARTLEDRVFGVASHDAVRVPAVPALQPLLHEAEVRHTSPLPSRLRGVAARALLPPTS